MSLLNSSGGNTSSDSIEWRTDSIVSIDSDWSTTNAQRTNAGIKMSAHSSMLQISVPIDSLKVENAKFTINVDSEDNTLTTNGVNNVVGLAKFYYGNDKDASSLDVATESFYPKYTFENDFVQDFTVIKMQSGRELKRVDIIISSSERSAVIIRDIELVFNQSKAGGISEKDLKPITDRFDSMSSDFKSLSDRLSSTEKGLQRLVIPLWTQSFLEEHNMGGTLEDGEIGRMESMVEFSYVYTDDETILKKMKEYQEEIEDIEYRLWVAQMAEDDTTGLKGLLETKQEEYKTYIKSLKNNKKKDT